MKYGYAVGPVFFLRGGWYRTLRYVSSKGIPKEKVYACDERGNFYSGCDGAVDAYGRPRYGSLEEARQASRYHAATHATYRRRRRAITHRRYRRRL